MIGVVSDIHGNLLALEAVVADMTRRGISEVVNLGDSLSGPLLPRETGEFLMRQPWFHLAGNHERQIFQDRSATGFDSDLFARSQITDSIADWIRSLRHTVELPDGVVYCHGTPGSDTQYLLETVTASGIGMATRVEIAERLGVPGSTLVLCGHSHVPRALRVEGTMIVNPGSVGLPAYSCPYPVPHVVETGSVDARYAIVEQLNGQWRTELVCVPYDFSEASALALRRGAHDWALALRTGRVQA